MDDGRYFVGLALDETSQYELTDQRLASWLPQVLDEMTALAPELAGGQPPATNG